MQLLIMSWSIKWYNSRIGKIKRHNPSPKTRPRRICGDPVRPITMTSPSIAREKLHRCRTISTNNKSLKKSSLALSNKLGQLNKPVKLYQTQITKHRDFHLAKTMKHLIRIKVRQLLMIMRLPEVIPRKAINNFHLHNLQISLTMAVVMTSETLSSVSWEEKIRKMQTMIKSRKRRQEKKKSMNRF